MLRIGIFATLLLGSAFYFPIPGSDPCKALTNQWVLYLHDMGITTGFENLPIDEMKADIIESVDNQFVYPVRWGCAVEYWRNEADPQRIDSIARKQFRRQLTAMITAETGQEPDISEETLNELFLESLKEIY